MPTFAEQDVRSLAGGVDHCHGVAIGPGGTLYCAGYAGQIYRVDLESGRREQYAQLAGGRLLGLAVDANGNLYGGDCLRGGVVRVAPTGEEEFSWQPASDTPLCCPTALVFDRAGNLYVADRGNAGEHPGTIWKISPDGSAIAWQRDGLATPGGLALNAAEDRLYVADTIGEHVYAIEIRPDGTAGPLTQLCETPRMRVNGLAVDGDGHLWLVCHRPDALFRLYLPSLRLERVVEDWRGEYLRGPCAMTFAGPQRDVIVTSSLDNACLYRLDADIAGQPLNFPQRVV